MSIESGPVWSKFIITDLGLALRTKVIAEKESIEFTRAEVGEGKPINTGAISTMTNLVNYKEKAFVVRSFVDTKDNCHAMIIKIDNTDFQDRILVTEVGIFAKQVGTDTEVLYGYAYAVSGYADMPPGASGHRTWNLICNTKISITSNVIIVYDGTGVYVTFEELEQAIENHNLDPESHPFILEQLGKMVSKDNLTIDLDKKVDKVVNKGLSTNDYTAADQKEVEKIKSKFDKGIQLAGTEATDLNTMKTEGLFFKSSGAENTLNAPTIAVSFSILVERTGAYGDGVTQTFKPFHNGEIFTRTSNVSGAGTWGKWEKTLFEADAIGNDNVTLTTGWEHIEEGLKSYYVKDKSGNVNVSLACYRKSGITIDANKYYKITNLPLKNRPRSSITARCDASVLASIWANAEPAVAYIDTNGDVYAKAMSAGKDVILIDAVFNTLI